MITLGLSSWKMLHLDLLHSALSPSHASYHALVLK